MKETTRTRIRSALEAQPATPAQLARSLKCCLKRVASALERMHAEGEAHRGGWTVRAAIWYPGPGTDAPTPPSVRKRLEAQDQARAKREEKRALEFLSIDHRTDMERALCPSPGDMPRLPYLRVPV